MKKILSAVITAVMIISLLSGCAGDTAENTVFSAADAQKSVMGAVEGTAAASCASKMGTVKVYGTDELLMDALRSGAVDCAVIQDRYSGAAMKGQRGVKKLDEQLFDVKFRFAVAKENADLTRDIDSVLSAMAEEGTLDRITKDFYEGRYEQPERQEEETKAPIENAPMSIADQYYDGKTLGDYSMNSTMDQQLMRNVEQYVLQNMSRGQISLEEMASAMGMGRVPFFHKIRSITTKTPAEVVRELRLKHACTLLVTTNINLSELAINVGFMTAENFINIFREKYGMTPLEYRLKNKR